MVTNSLPDAHTASARIRFARSMAARDPSLRLYAILDAESCSRRGLELLAVAHAWKEAGVCLLQYRDKTATREAVLRNATKLRSLFPEGSAFLILNDHADLVAECGFDGVHVGQTDRSVSQARTLVGPERVIGVSTHSADQALHANSIDADYIAIGPVFATASKANAEPTVGLCGVQAARAVTTKPLVAIGGIGIDQVCAVQSAGADAIAGISALLANSDHAEVTRRAEDFLARLK